MTFRIEHNGYLVELLEEVAQCEQFENALRPSGITLPFSYRSAWLETQPSTKFLFFAIHDLTGRAVYGFAVVIRPTRALPGHVTWLVERFGPQDEKSGEAGLHAMTEYARRQSRLLRIHLETFSRDADLRHRIGDTATMLGFRKCDNMRMYTKTIAIDLRPDEEAILASLHSTARRHIRALGKNPVSLRPVTNGACAPRLAELLHETMARTGGHSETHDWTAIINLSNRHPQLSRLVGLFREDSESPEALLAFAWGRYHGDHVDYAVAASTRAVDIKMPLAYAIAWDLICWAKKNGATWFDFAGITAGSHASADRLGGISDFKRYFSEQVVVVGEEWVFEPHPIRAWLASAVSAGAAWVRKIFK